MGFGKSGERQVLRTLIYRKKLGTGFICKIALLLYLFEPSTKPSFYEPPLIIICRIVYSSYNAHFNNYGINNEQKNMPLVLCDYPDLNKSKY